METSSREISFDLYSRAKYLDPGRMEKTVYVSPIAANVTPEILKVSRLYELLCTCTYVLLHVHVSYDYFEDLNFWSYTVESFFDRQLRYWY